MQPIDVKRQLIARIEANFPGDLLTLDQWVTWRKVVRNDKATKAPCTPTGSMAQSNNPATWNSFENCATAYLRGNFSGVGFMFSEYDPFCGVDFDKCVEDGVITPGAAQRVAALDTYSEFSQSGTGVHCIGVASLPSGGRKRNDIEIYDRLRFFVVTGDRLPDTPTTANNFQSAIDGLYTELTPQPSQPAHRRPQPTGAIVADDQELLNRMFASRNGGKVQQLFNGDMGGYGSQSEAELALCGHLAFWTQNDEQRIDRLFRQSGLYRDKWERSARAGETYGQGTIKRALTSQVYTGRRVVAVRVTL